MNASGSGESSTTAADAIAALRRLETSGGPDPYLLGYWPADTVNPFQDLLYRRTWAHGIGPIPLSDPSDAAILAEVADGSAGAVLHLHWLASVLAEATDNGAASAAAAAFERQLDELLARNVELVWTVHNVLPHDARFREVEARIRQAVADRARVVHVLTERTADAAAGTFTLPADRTLHVPHPSYAGAYPDRLSRDQARQALGLDHDAIVTLLIGGIRPYKGLDTLLAAWNPHAAGDPRRRLVIAGPARRDAETQRLLETCHVHPAIDLHVGRIPSDDVATFLRAADVAVLPYRETLNSGVLLLALTFGLPVVVVDAVGLGDLAVPEVARTFASDDVIGLGAALAAAEAMPRDEVAAAAARAMADRAPDAVAERFAVELRRRLGEGRGTTSGSR